MEQIYAIAKNALQSGFAQYKAQFSDEEFEGITEPSLQVSENPKFGHYQLANSMKISKALKSKNVDLSPKDVSEILKAEIEKYDAEHIIAQIELASIFVNLFLSNSYLLEAVRAIFLTSPDALPTPPKYPQQRIVIDFSSPNVAKSMHVGHLRSTIIGDSVCRLFEYLGCKVDRVNHLGDWGTEFGMLIQELKEENITDTVAELPISDLVEFYKKSKVRFDEDENFKKLAQLEVVKLQAGEPQELTLWRKLVDLSLREFQTIYDILDIKIEPFGESFYNPFLAEIVELCMSSGIAEVSNGAVIIQLEGFQFPLIIRKSDGAFNYDTTDMACIRYRSQTLKGDRLIYVTDLGQQQHFYLIFSAAEKLHWIRHGQAEHMGFGVVCGEDGKRLKTRSGETVKLIDLLQEAVKQARKVLEQSGKQYTEAEMDQIAQAVGIGAVKYADLSCQRTRDYKFSYEKMLSFKGNTACYMLYSYARICQIIAKTGLKREQIYADGFVAAGERTFEAQETNLLVQMFKMQDVLLETAKDLMPNRICDFMYNLCTAFTDFYEHCRVIDESGKCDNVRLGLCEMTRQALKLCFQLLGIRALDKM